MSLARDALALLAQLADLDEGAGVYVDRADFANEEPLSVLLAEGDLVEQLALLPSHVLVRVLPRGRRVAQAFARDTWSHA